MMTIKITGLVCTGNGRGGVYIGGKSPNVEIRQAVISDNGGPGIQIDPNGTSLRRWDAGESPQKNNNDNE